MGAGPYWIAGLEPGKLAIIPRPRGGDWLDDDVRAWSDSGFDVIVSLLTPDEAAEFGLRDEGTLARAASLEFVHLPIPDRGVPPSRGEAQEVLTDLAERLALGRTVGIHCRQGIGRSGLMAASLLRMAGIPAAAAFDRISKARGRAVPETPEQARWVEDLDRHPVARLPAASRRTVHPRSRRRR